MMFPASSERRRSAATRTPRRSFPSALARRRHCSRLSAAPCCASSTCSIALRMAVAMRGATSAQSSRGKFSSSICVQVREGIAVLAFFASTEQIVLLPYQVARASPAWLILKSTHDANRCAIKLAADEASSASQFIGDGLGGGAQLISVRVALATIIQQRLHSSHSDCHFAQTLAPRTAERVGDDNRNRNAHCLLNPRLQAGCRTIRILRQKHCGFSAVNVRGIHAAVCTDEAVTGLGDQDPILLAHDALSFAQSEFYYTRVNSISTCP